MKRAAEQLIHSQFMQEKKLQPIINEFSSQNVQGDSQEVINHSMSKSNTAERQGNLNSANPKESRNKSRLEMKYMEAMPLEEFATTEHLDASLLMNPCTQNNESFVYNLDNKVDTEKEKKICTHNTCEVIDPIVLIDGKPAKQGADLDKQITLFYQMECCICHGKGFDFKSLMKHYKERHGVPGYVTCCEKKFHYFYPKKIIEHMAYHLQPNIFMCQSCHQNFHSSQELTEHESNGGKSEGKITCPRCSERYPTYRELGRHIITHRADKSQCDYCGKTFKHHHRKKTVNRMENLLLCSHCLRTLKNIEKHEKEKKEKLKSKSNDTSKQEKYRKFHQALEISSNDDASTE
ncbi:unnamed protein product [Parnassius apollo]|uniref:(apollo) hypothetical protein n=1 Tax=Parnassius apollo TaxID=110799 RepID=A0A8S3WRS7_PARAO|nr:unnamed protein product [Parnassius apollo]